MKFVVFAFLGTSIPALVACGNTEAGGGDTEAIGQATQAFQRITRRDAGPPLTFSLFSFTSTVSKSGKYADGDVRLDSVTRGDETWSQDNLQKVEWAKILVDNGVDSTNGGHNLASGRGISSDLDGWEDDGPATVTPTSEDLAESLGNFDLTSIVVTRENVGTASVELRFREPSTTFFFWERGDTTSPTGANSDTLVEALDGRGRTIASHKLLRTEYSATGISVTTWNGAFKLPSTPDGALPVLGSVGLSLEIPVSRLRLTSTQQAAGGTQDNGPDYKVVASDPEHSPGRR
ncbi:MAG TPA: exosortase-dependent surface protein XDP2 [Polyangiaceae bacterium]|nr:exosortase-dependent surface protein XDP2 [Polyangiaceae bacterium]